MSRVSRALFVVLVVAGGCGGLAPSAPLTAPAPAALGPAPAAPSGPVSVAPVSCADAGVLLARKFNAYDDAMIAKHEGEIAKACTAASWPQAVLDCIGTTIADTDKCVDQLPHEAQVALVSSITAATPPTPPELADDDDKFTPCELSITAPEAFGPAPEGTAEDVAFAIAVRRHRLVDACNSESWGEHAKECFQKAGDAEHVGTCMRKLPDQQQTGATVALMAAADLATKTMNVRKTPANITCPKVVAAHYGDAAWKDKLAKVTPAQKKTAMTSSRAKMTKACTADKWTPTVRACVIAAGDFPECSQLASGVDPWGFPAFGVLVPTGVASCDKYLAGLAKLAECPKAKDMRAELFATISSGTSTISEMSDDSRKLIGEACQQGIEGLPEQFKAYDCKP